ncbi:unnamed protein product, partial [Aphanomyces euteiches]
HHRRSIQLVLCPPIVNIDGYDTTWNGNRYQRKNANQVDLNRKFPTFFTNPNPPSQSADDYPGPKPFSEPESKGIADWLKAHNSEIVGWKETITFGSTKSAFLEDVAVDSVNVTNDFDHPILDEV